MFLHQLNRNEKELFLELAYVVAKCDGNIGEEENDIIQTYRKEMMFDKDEYQLKDLAIDDILTGLKNSKNQVKNAVFIEIMAIVLADDIYHEKEKELVSIIKRHLDISTQTHDLIVKWILDMKSLYERANIIING